MIQANVVKLAVEGDPKVVEIREGGTLAEALEKAGINFDPNTQVMVCLGVRGNLRSVSANDPVCSGDVVYVFPKQSSP